MVDYIQIKARAAADTPHLPATVSSDKLERLNSEPVGNGRRRYFLADDTERVLKVIRTLDGTVKITGSIRQ